jgi:hypothetical protein
MQNPHPPAYTANFLTRRDILTKATLGLGALGFSSLMGRAASPSLNPLATKTPHFSPQVKRVIHIFANGGPSHVDTFDPKPKLDEWHGKPIPDHRGTERPTGGAWRSPFSFKKYGQSGIEISELFSKLGEQAADELCVIRSMQADVPNHEPSLMLMNCGEARLVRPSVGSWITYGLGSENENLPGFIAMCPGGYPIQESQNWQAAFLPGAYQGTYIDTQHQQIEQLIANIRNPHQSRADQRRQIDLLQAMNRRHQAQRQGDAMLEARVHSFELAYRMQLEATDAFDIEREPASIREMYGTGAQARQLLIARRLIERGVRYVQVWHGAQQPWDHHDDLEAGHRKLAQESDQPIAALLVDLKQRGLLQDTLVIWGGEFGRTPTVELPTAGVNKGNVNGRDHNSFGFSMWLAGGGVKKGYIHGATDEFGFAAVDKPVHIHDFHATLLHLLGFDHEKLTFNYAGRDFRLTDVHGHVVKDILA